MCVCYDMANDTAVCIDILRGMSALLGSHLRWDDCLQHIAHSHASDVDQEATAQDVSAMGGHSSIWVLCRVVVRSRARRPGF